jgi:hypothetical protein
MSKPAAKVHSDFRQRKDELGLVYLRSYVPKDKADELRAICDSHRLGYLRDSIASIKRDLPDCNIDEAETLRVRLAGFEKSLAREMRSAQKRKL